MDLFFDKSCTKVLLFSSFCFMDHGVTASVHWILLHLFLRFSLDVAAVPLHSISYYIYSFFCHDQHWKLLSCFLLEIFEIWYHLCEADSFMDVILINLLFFHINTVSASHQNITFSSHIVSKSIVLAFFCFWFTLRI